MFRIDTQLISFLQSVMKYNVTLTLGGIMPFLHAQTSDIVLRMQSSWLILDVSLSTSWHYIFVKKFLPNNENVSAFLAE